MGEGLYICGGGYIYGRGYIYTYAYICMYIYISFILLENSYDYILTLTLVLSLSSEFDLPVRVFQCALDTGPSKVTVCCLALFSRAIKDV